MKNKKYTVNIYTGEGLSELIEILIKREIENSTKESKIKKEEE